MIMIYGHTRATVVSVRRTVFFLESSILFTGLSYMFYSNRNTKKMFVNVTSYILGLKCIEIGIRVL